MQIFQIYSAHLRPLLRLFLRAEAGVGLTEYLVLLGILVGAVIGAVQFLGDSLAAVWTIWTVWIATALDAPS